MTVYIGIVETILFLAFIAVCVIMNYRKGRQDGIDQMIDHMKAIGTLKIVKENGKNVYLFATHEITND